jgi:hypothetical protein
MAHFPRWVDGSESGFWVVWQQSPDGGKTWEDVRAERLTRASDHECYADELYEAVAIAADRYGLPFADADVELHGCDLAYYVPREQ